MNTGLRDFREAITLLPKALYFAWSDTKARYKRSVLGPFWLVLSTIFGVVGLGVVWSILLNADRAEFIPSLTIGLIVWQLISGCLAEAPAIFYRQSGQIKDINLPSFFVSFQLVMRQIINFGHNLIVFAIVTIVYPHHASLLAFVAIPGLVLVVANLLWLVQVLGYVGARYRDLEPLIGSFLPILFFVSPVIYRAGQLGPMARVMAFNPIGNWISLVRDPLMGELPNAASYGVALATTAAGWSVALWLTTARRRRLPYWI